MSATPGHSQHQLRTAVDFTNAAAGYEAWQASGSTTAYSWLLENASRHASCSPTPATGRPRRATSGSHWHYRYVGPENARRLRESGLSLQEFLARENVLPRC
ncbi:MAG: D-alanyl-D-alanine carboxypeptidase family protein [Actinomycetota bacterium]|nr:D-alanyl-D-alanine carboxypeptidase family protein [Actinomycetota bacterium]